MEYVSNIQFLRRQWQLSSQPQVKPDLPHTPVAYSSFMHHAKAPLGVVPASKQRQDGGTGIVVGKRYARRREDFSLSITIQMKRKWMKYIHRSLSLQGGRDIQLPYKYDSERFRREPVERQRIIHSQPNSFNRKISYCGLDYSGS